MQTLRKIVSELATDVKALNLDDRVSFRFLASKFNSQIQYFFRLEAKSREFAKLPIWKPIDCVKLEQVDTSACGYIDYCNVLYRSVCQLPEAYASNYGLLIKVLTIDGKREYKIISSSSDYQDYVNRRWKGKLLPCYIEDKYLYIPDVYTEAVKVSLIPIDPFEADKCNGTLTNCSNPLDAQVNYPEYLIKLAKREVLNELLPEKRIMEDEKGNDDTNQKD